MIEAGIVKLVSSDPGVAAVARSGGFWLELPKDEALFPSWTYRVISNRGDYALTGEHGFTDLRLEINCHAATGGDVFNLAYAIDQVLSGYKGVLADPDSTLVYGCFSSDTQDFFDDAARTFRRMLEYEIQFDQP